MQWLSDKIDAALTWLGQLVHNIFIAIIDLLTDIAIKITDLVLTAIASLISSIPAPSFTTSGQSLFDALPAGVTYFLGRSGLAEGLAVLAAGLTFRLLRKLFTLGQW